MWKERKPTPQRAGCVLIIDQDEPATAPLARDLARLGMQVFYTAAAHVGRRLSQEYFFDLVVVDDRLDAQTQPCLSDVVARDGHRFVVLSFPDAREPAAMTSPPRRAGVRRPLNAERLFNLSVEVARNASAEQLRRWLDPP